MSVNDPEFREKISKGDFIATIIIGNIIIDKIVIALKKIHTERKMIKS